MSSPNRWRRWFVILAGAPALVVACDTVAPLAMSLGGSLMDKLAKSNYDRQYQKMLGGMMDVLSGATLASEESVGMDASAATAASEPEPLQLDVAVLRESRSDIDPTPVPVNDADVLRDDHGIDQTGDNLRIVFSARSACYVYAVWVDATAWATPIFPYGPAGSFQNPVEPGRQYALPADAWYELDEYRGVESLYLVASRQPVPELDAILQQLVGRTRPELSTAGAPLGTLTQPNPITRGLKGVRPGRTLEVVTTDGATHAASAEAFMAEIGVGDLVITRWFQHE